MRTKILPALVAICLFSSQVNALTLLSIGECRSISLVFFGVAAVGLGIGVPLLTVETNALGYRKCPSEISNCTSTCIYKTCENCTSIPVLTRCSSTSNGTIYSEKCDKDAIVGCFRNDTHAEVARVFQRNDSAREAGIAFVVIGSVAALVGLFAAANVEQANKFASQPGLSH